MKGISPIIVALLAVFLVTTGPIVSFMSPTVRDAFVIATFVLLLLTVVHPFLKRLIFKKRHWRPFTVDFGTHAYTRNYNVPLKNNEQFSDAGYIKLVDNEPTTFLLRVRPRMRRRHRRQPELIFHIRLVSRSRNWRKLWLARKTTEDGPRVDYINNRRINYEINS